MRTRNNIIKSNCVPEVCSDTGGGPGALKCSSSREYYGDGQIVESGSLEMSRFGGGYFDADGSPFYYFSDYQGNNISVVDNKGNVCQTTDYYPYGEVWRVDNSLTLGTKNTFLYSDKEYLSMDGLHEYDFSARRQTPAVPGFNRIDPDCEKYYDINPYVFCGSNPVMNIDPTGKDIYTFDDTGKYLSREENTENDIIKIDGSDAELTLEYGTIKDLSDKKKTNDGHGYLEFSVYKDSTGKGIFEFLAKNTNVEWSHLMTGADDNGLNYLTTSHEKNMERGAGVLIDKGIGNIRKMVHNHPGGAPYPSGLYDKTTLMPSQQKGDMELVKKVNDELKNNSTFAIFIAESNRYIEYNINSKIEDFPELDRRREIDNIKKIKNGIFIH